MDTTPAISLSEFTHSLPESYQLRFSPVQMAAHAHVAARRGSAALNVAMFPWPDSSVTALCVVADDRPGLLALISEALLDLGVSVQEAEAYTRKTASGSQEAVDLFWVKNSHGEALSVDNIEELSRILRQLLSGERPLKAPRDGLGDAEFDTETTVRFIESGDHIILEVETDDRSGLLHALTRALFEMQVQITSSQVKTVERRVVDRFALLEFDGSPINEARRLEIQVAVLSTIEPVTQVRERSG